MNHIDSPLMAVSVGIGPTPIIGYLGNGVEAQTVSLRIAVNLRLQVDALRVVVVSRRQDGKSAFCIAIAYFHSRMNDKCACIGGWRGSVLVSGYHITGVSPCFQAA